MQKGRQKVMAQAFSPSKVGFTALVVEVVKPTLINKILKVSGTKVEGFFDLSNFYLVKFIS